MNNGLGKNNLSDRSSVSDEPKREHIHEFSVQHRKALRMSGVSEVLSFDDESVSAMTECGEVVIDGSGLRISVLDTDRGLLSLEGDIGGIYYVGDAAKAASKSGRGIFRRR